ncbi:MAG: hypothetical protein ACOC40_02690 [Thermoplasmatota archaeon]
MADPITEISQKIRALLISNDSFSSIFNSRFYLYKLPDDISYPYATAFEIPGESWMTLGNTNSGEIFTFPIYAFGKDSSVLREGTSAINNILHLNEFTTDNYQVIYARRINWSKPELINDETNIYAQQIMFELRIEKL